jgi:hypothetical protein
MGVGRIASEIPFLNHPVVLPWPVLVLVRMFPILRAAPINRSLGGGMMAQFPYGSRLSMFKVINSRLDYIDAELLHFVVEVGGSIQNDGHGEVGVGRKPRKQGDERA